MSQETHAQYFSKNIKISDIVSPKEFIGMKKRSIEVTVGNAANPTTYRNPEDVADTKNQDIKEMLLELFKITDEIALEKSFKFVDTYTKEKVTA